MKVHHTQPEKMTTEQRERLNDIASEAMDLYFKLTDEQNKDAELVLPRGIKIELT